MGLKIGRNGTLEVGQPDFSERLCQILVSSVLEVCKEFQLSNKGRFLDIYTDYEPTI